MNSPAVIAKVARFEWELPRLSMETLIYKGLEDTDLAPRFIGHVHEHGRVIGFMLEKLEGREANINDLSSCQSALQRLHDIGILHGDANRYNFIIQDGKARLIDF
jgi:tRNA A-37 threonylcarbamoyl transferase component Bud32